MKKLFVFCLIAALAVGAGAAQTNKPTDPVGSELLATVRFASADASRITEESKINLAQAAQVIRDRHNSTFILEGYADSRGKAKANLALSRNRAEKVKKILVKEYKIDAKRLFVVARGTERPIAVNDTPEGRAFNRRVEIRIKNELADEGNTYPEKDKQFFEGNEYQTPKVGSYTPHRQDQMTGKGDNKPNVGNAIPAPDEKKPDVGKLGK